MAKYGEPTGSNTQKARQIADTLYDVDYRANKKNDRWYRTAEGTVQTPTVQTPKKRFTAEQSRVIQIIKDGRPSGANEIRRTPALRTAYEELTGRKIEGNSGQQVAQILNTDVSNVEVPETNPADWYSPLAPEQNNSGTAYNALVDNLIGVSYNNSKEMNTNGRTNEQNGDLSGNAGTVEAGEPEGRPVYRVSGEERVQRGGNPGYAGNAVTPSLKEQMNNSGIVDVGLDPTDDGAVFSAAINEAKAKNPKNGVFVSPKTEEEIAEIVRNGGKVFLASDGSAGVIVTADGDIEAVFKNQETGKKGALDDLMLTAIANGGVKLDCYGLKLVNMYERYGFVPVAQVDFNPEYVESGWDFNRHGTPPIYFMVYNGEGAANTLSKKDNLC